LAVIALTPSTTTITNSIITDARSQGCIYWKDGREQYQWKIQDAIDDLTTGGNITVGAGTYYEDLTYDVDQTTIFEGAAILKTTAGATVDYGTIDLTGKTKTKIIHSGGVNASSGVSYSNINEGSSAGQLPPIGSVIGIHPDVKTTLGLDTSIWSPCDGVASLPTAYFNTGNDTNVPDLTDNRFLQGDTTYSTGGSTNISTEDKYYNGTGDEAGESFIPVDSWSSGSGLLAGGKFIKLPVSMATQDASSDNVSFDLFFTPPIKDNRPLYFSVKYYMRIK
jgi:hypothetical protein